MWNQKKKLKISLFKKTPRITSHPTATVKPTNKNNQTIFDKQELG